MTPLLKYEDTLRGMIIKDSDALNLIWKQLGDIIGFQQPVELSDEAVINWDASSVFNATVTLEGSRTLAINNLTEGDYGTLRVVQGGSGSYTLTLPSSPVSKVGGGGSGAVTLSTDVGAIDFIGWHYQGGVLYFNVTTNFT